ncbi:MAG: hypothetical protein ABIX19_04975, partial [Gemmatimonadaceae bacterium]
MRARMAVGAALALSLAACKTDKPASRDSGVAVAPAVAAPVAQGTCPRTGHWGDCQLRARLDQSGLAPHSTDEDVGNLPKLDVAPVKLKIDNSGLAFYVFADSNARHRAAAGLDTVHFIPQAKPVSLKAETTVIQNDNLLVLLFSKNEHQRERVSDAVTAGA